MSRDPDSAYALALMQERFARKAGLDKVRVRALEHQANSLLKLGDMPAAMARYDTILAIERARGDSARVASTLRSKGGLLYRSGDFGQASELYHQALRIRDALGDTVGAARILTSLGILSMDHGDPEGALNYYRKSLAMHISVGDSVSTAIILNTICTPLRALGRCAEALANNQRAIKMHERAGRPIGVAASLNHMAAAYNCMGRPHEALDHARRSMRIRVEIADTIGVAYAQLQEARALAQLGRYSAAVRSANEALRISTELVQMPIRVEAAELLHGSYKALGNWQKALEMHELYVRLNDSLSGDRTKRALITRDLQYRYDRAALADSLEQVAKAEELRRSYEGRLEVEKARRRFTIVVGATVALALAIITFLLVHWLRQAQRSRAQQKELHDQRVNELLRKSEIDALNAMLEGQEKERDRVSKDLHDRLGSMLSAIKHQIDGLDAHVQGLQAEQRGHYTKVNRMLDEAVGEVRRISHDMVSVTLARFGLEKALEDLCDSVRLNGRLVVELSLFGLEQRMERGLEITVYRMVQELVSNVLKHAGAHELSIAVTRGPGRLSVLVADDGRGFDTEAAVDGIGLANVRARAAAIGAQVSVNSTPGKGTTVSIEGPVVE